MAVDPTPTMATKTSSEAGPGPARSVTVVPVPRGGPGAGVTDREWRLGILAAVGDLLTGSATPGEVVQGLGRLLVGRLVDWVVVIPLASHRDRDPVLLFADAAALQAAFGRPAPPAELELVDEVALRGRPPSEPTWTEGEGVRFAGPDGEVEMPAGTVGAVAVGGERLRYGTVLLGRLPGAAELSEDDRDLVERIGAKVSAALESGELAREAQRAARVRDAVVDVVVHDLATPVNALELVVGRMLAARSPRDTAEVVLRYGESARRALAQMRSLLSDLGDLRDMEQGMFSAHLSDQPVCEILASAVERVEDLAKDRAVTVRLTTDACPLRVVADPLRTIQCLGNLLAHAIQVSAPGETVLLIPRRAGDRAEIDVVDRGPGIPADRLPHLFDRFAWARDHDGRRRGLGLMIAQEIALAHGESLGVDTAVGRGTRFTLSLALAPGKARGRRPSGE